MQSTHEELRRKHIQTLEVLQRLTEENDRLRRCCGNTAAPNIADQCESERLENTNEIASLRSRIVELEQNAFGLTAELESERVVHIQELSELRAELARVNDDYVQRYSASVEKVKHLQNEDASLRNDTARALAELNEMKRYNEVLRGDVAAADTAAQDIRNLEEINATNQATLTKQRAHIVTLKDSLAALKNNLEEEKVRATNLEKISQEAKMHLQARTALA